MLKHLNYVLLQFLEIWKKKKGIPAVFFEEENPAVVKFFGRLIRDSCYSIRPSKEKKYQYSMTMLECNMTKILLGFRI